VTENAIAIREFREGDLETVVEFSLRAWAPVFASLRHVLGDDIFLRLHPDWRANQAEAVRSSCTNDDREVFVAVADGRPVGFVAIELNAFHERMGVIDIIGVDPDYQRRGISLRLRRSRLSTCGVAGWTSPWSRPAATPATHPRGRHTKAQGSHGCPSDATSGCWPEQDPDFGCGGMQWHGSVASSHGLDSWTIVYSDTEVKGIEQYVNVTDGLEAELFKNRT
jgi:GNAT superfamily N-acetyltransferase